MLQIFNKYNPNANPANTDYPNGSGKDESVSGANDGTPLEMDWYNDMLGFSEALLTQGRLTPSGNADTALVSDRLDGFRLAALRVQTACDYTDGDLSLVDVIHVGLDIATVDYVIDRNTLTRWVVGSATGTVTADELNVSTGALSGVSGTLTNINSDNKKLGVNQSYVDETTNRLIGVTYTNNTDDPIFISVTTTNSTGSSADANLIVDGIIVQSQRSYGNSPLVPFSNVSAIVPAGLTYSVSGNTLSKWWELKK